MKKLMLSTAMVAALAFPAVAQEAAAEGKFRTEVDPTEIHASDFMGMRVYSTETEVEGDEIAGVQDNWEDIGEIHDIVLSRDGGVEAVLVDIGGFLGIGERRVAVDMDSIRFMSDSATADAANDYFLVLNASRAELEEAPEYRLEQEAEMAATDTGAAVEGTAEEGAEEVAEAGAEAEVAAEEAGEDVAAAGEQAVEATEDAAAEAGEEVAEAGAEAEAAVEGETEVAEGEAVVEGEGEAEVAEGEAVVEGEGEAVAEGEAVVEGEGEAEVAEGEAVVEGEGETEVAEGEAVVEGEGETEVAAAETAPAAEGEAATEGTDMAATEREPMVRDGFASAEADFLTTENLTGARVYDSNDEWIGEISELLVSDEGKLTEAIVDVGGFLGIGEKPVALGMDQLDILRQDGGDEVRIYVPMTKEELEAMPAHEG